MRSFLTLGLSQSEAKLDLPEQIAEWKLEPELDYPVPRRALPKTRLITKVLGGTFVFLFMATLFVFVPGAEGWLAVFLMLGVGAFVAYCITWDHALSKSLVERGVSTRGVVVRREWQDGEAGGCFVCTVAYDTSSGSRLTLSAGDQELVTGDTLTILYLPESPEQAMPYKDCDYKAVLVPEECR